MRFELPLSRTLEFGGSRTIPVKSCGAKKRSFTVTLAVTTDGSKLPPAVIFKGVCTPRDLAAPDSVRVWFHKKGWMDEKGKLLFVSFFTVLLLISGVKEWIRTCLLRNPDKERLVLVWDSLNCGIR